MTQGDIPRFTFPPTTLNSATTVAFVKLTTRKDEGQLEGSEDQLLPVVGSLGTEVISAFNPYLRISSVIALGLMRPREQQPMGHLFVVLGLGPQATSRPGLVHVIEADMPRVVF